MNQELPQANPRVAHLEIENSKHLTEIIRLRNVIRKLELDSECQVNAWNLVSNKLIKAEGDVTGANRTIKRLTERIEIIDKKCEKCGKSPDSHDEDGSCLIE